MFSSASGGSLAGRAHVEADDDGLRGDREVDVALGDRADRRVDDRQPHLLAGELGERVGEGLDRALHVALDDDAQLLLAALGDALRELLERDLRRRRDEALGHLALAALGDLLRLLRVLHGVHAVARVGDLVEAEDLHRRRRAGLVDLLAVLVRHRADLAEPGAGEDEVADPQRAVLNEHARDGAAAAVEQRLEHGAARGRSWRSP